MLNCDIPLKPFIKKSNGGGIITGSVTRNASESMLNTAYSQNWFSYQPPFNGLTLRNITVYLCKGNDVIDWCLTNDEGIFRFDSINDGNYTLKTEIFNTPSYSANVSISGGNTIEVNLSEVVAKNSKQSGINTALLYPNFADDIVFVNNGNNISYNYHIYSIDGKIVKSGTTNMQINISNLSPGSYFIRLYTNDTNLQIQRVIKQD